jgi:hypothetical protein
MNGIASTSTTTIENSGYIDLLGSYYNGTASVPIGYRIQSITNGTTPATKFLISSNNNGTLTDIIKIDLNGNNNTAVGYEALYSNTTGNLNAVVGYQTLYSNTTGGGNIAVGYQTLYSNTTGSGNSAVGIEALYSNTTAVYNSAFGWRTLYSNTTGQYNTAIGQAALQYNTTGNLNSAFGVEALNTYNNTTSANGFITAIGYGAGVNYTGSEINNTILGAVPGVAGESNIIRIGNNSGTLLYGVETNTLATDYLLVNGNIQTPYSNNLIMNPIASTSTTTIENSGYIDLLGSYWNGTASVPIGYRIQSQITGTTPSSKFIISSNDNGTLTDIVKIDLNGNNSTFMGWNAGSSNTGSDNCAFGNKTLKSSTVGDYITAVGGSALYNYGTGSSVITGATYMTAIGYGAGYNYTGSETNNTVLGAVNGVAGEINIIRVGNNNGTLLYGVETNTLATDYLLVNGNIQTPYSNNIIMNGIASTSTTTTENSGYIDLLGSYYNGTASVPYGFRLQSDITATTPTGNLNFNLNNNGTITTLMSISQSGSFITYNSENIIMNPVPSSANYNNSGYIDILGSYYNGTASTLEGFRIFTNILSTTPTGQLVFALNSNGTITNLVEISLKGDLSVKGNMGSLTFNTGNGIVSAPTVITVGASPFEYTNNTGYNIIVYIGGGVITAIAINGTTIASGLTSTTIHSYYLKPLNYITVTYTTAPSMWYINA